MAELKPCPFCGEKPHIDREEIFCNMCGAKMPFPFYEWGICGEGDFPEYKIARQEAIERWNTRAEEDLKVVQELKFTREFVHEHGLDFALASAWNRRAEDGK